jgi:hypothetical protein
MKEQSRKWCHLALWLLWVFILAFFFAEVEIQIEGGNGWASSLPTWRIEEHWLLDLFWGGRPMTGYHAWVFSFMILIFHLPIFIQGKWSWMIEGRIIASLQWFWLAEDFLWFVLNPDPKYGISNFRPECISWHKNWFLFMPVDYWNFIVVASVLSYLSFFGVPLFLKKLIKNKSFKKDSKDVEENIEH